MSARVSRHGRDRTLLIIAAVVAVLLIAGIAVSNYSVELGLASPSPGAVRAVATVAEIELTLAQTGDFRAFSEALYSGLAAHRRLAVNNPADGRVDAALGKALDCYSTLRQSWQAELEGEWDPATHGDPAYWRAFHPSVELATEYPLTAEQLREELRGEALVHVAAALTVVER